MAPLSDDTEIEAETANDAILAVRDYQPAWPHMTLSVASLTDAAGTVVWTLRAPFPEA